MARIIKRTVTEEFVEDDELLEADAEENEVEDDDSDDAEHDDQSRPTAKRIPRSNR